MMRSLAFLFLAALIAVACSRQPTSQRAAIVFPDTKAWPSNVVVAAREFREHKGHARVHESTEIQQFAAVCALKPADHGCALSRALTTELFGQPDIDDPDVWTYYTSRTEHSDITMVVHFSGDCVSSIDLSAGLRTGSLPKEKLTGSDAAAK